MGQLLNRSPLKPYDKEVLNYLKTKELKDITESLEIIQQDYDHVSYLTYSQFDDIFMGLLNDCEPFFLALQSDHNIEKTVDLYESLAAFIIFSGSSIEEKTVFIFQLFDFDKSETLELTEMIMTLQSAIGGLCKYVYLPIPSLQDVEAIALSIFLLIDHDNNKRITLDEFSVWVTNNFELQDFFLKYTGTQTIQNLHRRVDVFMSTYKLYFDNVAGGPHKDICVAEDLKSLLMKDNKSVPESEYDMLLQVMVETSAYEHDKTNTKNINRDVYNMVTKAWSAFTASDGDNENSISTKEFPNLLWVYQGEKPHELALCREMKRIDANHSNFIDRTEWLTYFTSKDKQTGKILFRGKLKTLFDKYADLDSGILALSGMKNLMWDMFAIYVTKATTEESKKDLHEMVNDLAKACMDAVDTGGNDTLEWEEFKDFMDVTRERQMQLKHYLEKNFNT